MSNEEAEVIGGPHDGDKFYLFDGAESFVPAKTAEGRPEYRMINGKWIFVGYLKSEATHDPD